MSGTVWSKFFWSDWESDPALRLCSFAAQGFWMRMLCIAAAHDPIGYVAVAGKALDETALARLTGCLVSEVACLIGELERNGVFSRDRLGRIYSRRMTADARKAAVARRNGHKGGNPNLSKHAAKSLPDKARDKTAHKPQSPMSRSPESSTHEKAGAFPGKKPPGWFSPKTHTDAANTIIEEIRTHDRSRIAAGGEGAGGDVLMLPAISSC
jgi:hypothetical protein